MFAVRINPDSGYGGTADVILADDEGVHYYSIVGNKPWERGKSYILFQGTEIECQEKAKAFNAAVEARRNND